MMLSFFSRLALSAKIRLLLISMAIPLIVAICVMMVMFTRFVNQYDRIEENLLIASEFNIDFKSDIDQKMYKYIVNKPLLDLQPPIEELNNARDLTRRLKNTTTRADSLQRLNGIERLLDNLEATILELRDGDKNYNWSIEWLNTKIYVLTEVIRDRYQEYIYYEVKNLPDIRYNSYQEVYQFIILSGTCIIIMVLLLFVFAFKTSNSISKPLKKLRKNVSMVSRGDFDVEAVDSTDDEVSALSLAFDYMIEQISVLMENVRVEQQNLHRAELRLLQEQIKPHFLYNTFDTIVWLAEDGQYEAIIHVISALSNFFRTSLSRGEDIIAIHVEILHIRSYLEIQQIRYSDILTFEIDMPKELDDYTIPKLSLQPLVENALYHGIKNKRGQGKIIVKGWIENDSICISVWDNGIGMSAATLERVRGTLYKKGEKIGFGMANMWERIRLYYGNRCNINIDSVSGEFTQITVRFPAKKIN